MATLKSARFSGDPDLDQVLNGQLRLGAVGTPPVPAPVLSQGPAIAKVQQALIDIGYPMPQFGADGDFGGETGGAVTDFKNDWHLQPNDPVVGPRTMEKLDFEMVALERPLPSAPPTPPPAPPGDPTGRNAAGLARVPNALAIAAAFGATGAGSPWLKLDRATVAAGIAALVTNPDSAEQGGAGLCTTAAFINVWAQDAPDSYAAFATALYNTGSAIIFPSQSPGTGQLITASAALMATDYEAVATNMRLNGYSAPSQADWMVMSAIRDSSNKVLHYSGDPDEFLGKLRQSAMSSDDLNGWLRAAGQWSTITDNTTSFFSPSLSSALALDPLVSRCFLTIDVAMLDEEPCRHTAVLRSPITLSGGIIKFRLWTWAGVLNVNVVKSKFENNYYGAQVAFL